MVRVVFPVPEFFGTEIVVVPVIAAAGPPVDRACSELDFFS